jgi:hypothetical protein
MQVKEYNIFCTFHKIEDRKVNCDLLCYSVFSIDIFECYCWQNYTTVSNTDLYLSYFDLSYIFPGHNDSIKRGLTVVQNQFDPWQLATNRNKKSIYGLMNNFHSFTPVKKC